MYIKSKVFGEEVFREKVYCSFEQFGVDRDRIFLQGQVNSLHDHLAAYGKVDIALDTFPYNGTTTTCEALWMGVPVISLCGGTHRSRVGSSILKQLDLAFLTADNVRAYIKCAISLSNDKPALARLRSSLRDVLASSTVCDAVRTTEEIEASYMNMIRQYRNNQLERVVTGK